MLRRVQAGNDTINVLGDGTLELVAKPFTVTDLGEGHFDVRIMTKSVEDLTRYIPHIAAQMGCTEEQLLEQLKSVTGSSVERRPDTVPHPIGLGGPGASRSAAKSALVLWATRVGNDEVKSPGYAAARDFVVAWNEGFNRESVRLDSRHLPHSEELQRRFGQFFNLIYIRSNEAGRVVAHFTLYNVISWRIVLAEAGGTPNLKIGLVSNPLDPGTWLDTIADEIDIDFAWLDNPDYSDQFQRARERLIAAMRHHVDTARTREVNRIVTEVFEKYGIVGEHTPVADPEVWKKIIWEASRRLAAHALRLPYVEEVPGEDIVAQLRAARAKPDDERS